MKELKTTGEALEQALEEHSKFVGKRIADLQYKPNKFIGSQEQSDLLFFPRKKLKMHKIASGNWKSRAWFTEERLDDRVTSLDSATAITHEGISSGFRSAIVLERDGKYLKLKGVAPQLFESLFAKLGIESTKNGLVRTMRGVNYLTEGFNEFRDVTYLNKEGFHYLSMVPRFLERFQAHLGHQDSQSFIDRFIGENPFPNQVNFDRIEGHAEKTAVLDKLSTLVNSYYSGLNLCVSAFEVTGDTRLDEAIYELTKKKLHGQKREVRDNLVLSASFNSGLALANLNSRYFAWSAKHSHTNAHIGNFVLDRNGRMMQSNLCDLGAIRSASHFDSMADYWNHVQREIESFRDDFHSPTTLSSGVPLRYKEFPKYLRESAFQALKTGYSLVQADAFRGWNMVFPKIAPPEKVTVPDKIFYTEREFRDAIKFVTE
ncbi:MAG: hypothetical protein WCI72_06750 [archaeon]